MQCVINKSFGGFRVPKELCDAYGFDEWDCNRDEVALIEYVKNNPNNNYYGCELVIVEIPDEATDYILEEYDGMEKILYVVDGKIYTAN